MHAAETLTNAEIAELFRQVAAVYTLRHTEAFRTQAYLSAASSIEQLATPLRDVWENGELDSIPGIGEKFQAYIDELFRTGHIKHFEKILRTEPAGMFPLLTVPGIGPQTAAKLARAFGLKQAATAVRKLASLARRGKVREVPGFSAVSEQKILHAVDRLATQPSERMLLSEAAEIAADVLKYVRAAPLVTQAEALGSVRRRVPTVGDIDIAVCTEKPAEFTKYLLQFPHLQKVISTGEKMTSFVHSSGRQIDIKTQTPDRWGSMLQHYTGSKLHNIHLRTLALSKGFSLSEYGISLADGPALAHASPPRLRSDVRSDGGRPGERRFTDEASFYKFLGLDFIPPELREDSGEIEAAKLPSSSGSVVSSRVRQLTDEGSHLPKLVELSDIRGDFHIHTSVEFPSSHDAGTSSVTELLNEAEKLGYSYLGFSDHQPKKSDLTAAERLAAVKARDASIDKAVAAWKSAKKSRVQFHVFRGFEVDILADGTLALEEDSLVELDYVIASIHSNFDLPRAAQTQRILKALAHPTVKIFGHPTARHLPDRPEIDCDWAQVFAFAASHHKLLEINATPPRTDLPSELIRQAIAAGVQLVINTDAHAASSLQFMQYGVWNARRGWASKKAIANTGAVWSFK